MDLLQFCSPSYDSFLPLSGVALIYVVLWHPTTAPNTYGALIFLNILLLSSGFALFALHQPQEVQSSAYRLALCVHSGAFGLACLLLAAHIPMAFLSRQSLKAMLSLGKGFLTEQEAMKHAARWVKEDLEIERKAFQRQSNQNQTILREKRLN